VIFDSQLEKPCKPANQRLEPEFKRVRFRVILKVYHAFKSGQPHSVMYIEVMIIEKYKQLFVIYQILSDFSADFISNEFKAS